MLYPNGSKVKPTISSRFGPRPVTIPGASSFHQGVDFVGFDNVKAVLGGKVTHAGPLGGHGNAVAIDVFTRPELVITHVYGHLANGSLAVRPGQTVAEGAQLARMGDTGTALGKNLHFEVRHWRGKNLTCIDPEPYLADGVNAAPAPAAQPAKPASTIPPTAMLKWTWTGIQRMLKGTGRYRGAIDNVPGPLTIKGFQAFVGVAQDGIFGPITCRAAQQWLKRRWGYAGAIDGIPGAGTKAAWDRAEDANDRAFAHVR